MRQTALTPIQRDTLDIIIKRVQKLFANQTFEEISEKTGIHRNRISKIVNYEPGSEAGQLVYLPDLCSIADAYQISLASLVERESDEKYLNATLRDALVSLRNLDRTLGYTVSAPVKGCRPAVTFTYSALDDFVYLISGMIEFEHSPQLSADNAKYRALQAAFNAKLRELSQYDARVFSVKGALSGKNILPSLYEEFGAYLFDYKHAPEEVKKDMRSTSEYKSVACVLSYLCDAKRRRDFAGICETVHIEPEAAEEKTGELIGSLLALLDDVPADRKLATSEQFRHLFYE